MGNKKKKFGKKPYLREDAVKNSIFLKEINKNPIKKKYPPKASLDIFHSNTSLNGSVNDNVV